MLLVFISKGHGQSNPIDIIPLPNGDTIVLSEDTLMRKQLSELDLNSFKGKTVEEFLTNETVMKYQRHWWTDEPPGKLSFLNLTYGPGLYLMIYSDGLEHQPRFSETMGFDLEKYKLEKIRVIRLNAGWFDDKVERHGKKPR